MPYVTLVKNPTGGVGHGALSNPRRRHHRRRRNPIGLSMVKSSLPDLQDVLAGGLGALIAVQIPAMFAKSSSGWTRILWATGGVIGAHILTRMVMGPKAGNMAALGGGIVVGLAVMSQVTGGKIGMALPATLAAALPTGTKGLALPVGTGMTGTHSQVGAFRESEFRGPAPRYPETTLS